MAEYSDLHRMRNIAFLTMQDTSAFMIYDRLLHEPLAKRGFNVTEVPWDAPLIDWSRFESVIIRSPWDYQARPEDFMQVLEEISKVTRLENPIEIVRWNLHKGYLSDLKDRGVPIVPTVFLDHFDAGFISKQLSAAPEKKWVVKPAISANADDTYVIAKGNFDVPFLAGRYGKKHVLLQPFLPSIQTEGEFSVFFFGETLSHTILKTPKTNDFRVQEEHGGNLALIKNPEPELLKAAWTCWKAISPSPLYGRVDLVRSGDHFLLMEVELIEPSLYFNMDPDSPEKFASVFAKWMER